MSLKLIREAILQSQYSASKKKTLNTLQEAVGKEAALRIIEAYTVTQDDYNKWLDVIEGFARDRSINIKTKTAFEDIAFAVLENDPAPIDETMKEAIVDTLWQHQKVKKTHSKVEKAARAKEEEEQLRYAIKKMKGGYQDEERAPAFSQSYNDAFEDEEDMFEDPECCDGEVSPEEVMDLSRQYMSGAIDFKTFQKQLQQAAYQDRAQAGGYSSDPRFKDDFEDEEDFDPDAEFDPRDFDDDLGDRDAGWDKRSGPVPPDDEEDWGDEYLPDDVDDEPEFGDDGDLEDFEDPRDAELIRRGEAMQKGRDLEDFDPASDEGMARDEQIMSRGRDIQKTRKFNEVEPRSKPRAFYAAEQEEMDGRDYSSPFSSGQSVIHKKTKATYVVEIPDGPGDQVGVKIDGRLTMVPSKDLEAINPTTSEDEEATSKQPTGGKVSYLHDVLTGANSQTNLRKLQQEIETQAANAWTEHHAKMPRNPHPKGSMAYKYWERGIKQAAKDVWAPKPVVEPKAKPKPKPKKR